MSERKSVRFGNLNVNEGFEYGGKFYYKKSDLTAFPEDKPWADVNFDADAEVYTPRKEKTRQEDFEEDLKALMEKHGVKVVEHTDYASDGEDEYPCATNVNFEGEGIYFPLEED